MASFDFDDRLCEGVTDCGFCPFYFDDTGYPDCRLAIRLEMFEFKPVVHAHWIEKTFTFECSACHGDSVDNYAYCPRCGAKMDEEVPE